MRSRAEFAPDRGVVVPLPTARRRPPTQAAIVPVAAGVTGVMFDADPQAPDAGRLVALIDGEPLAGPAISTRLDLRDGGRRRLLLLARPADRLVDRAIALSLDGQLVASIDPGWVQSPLRDGADLIEGLTDRGRRQLAKLFLTTGASLFGGDDAADFIRVARRLLDLLGVRTLSPASWSPLGASGRVLSYRIAAQVDPDRIGALVLMMAGRVARLPGCELAVEATDGGCALHVFIPHPTPPGAELVGLGEAPVHLRAPAADLPPQPLHAWLARRDGATRNWVHAKVEAEARRDPAAAALLRELRHPDDAKPSISIRHLSGTAAGLLYAIDLDDPNRLLRAVRIERDGAAVDVELGAAPLPRGIAAPLIGFADLPRAYPFDDACRIRLAYRSGRLRTVHEGPSGIFTGPVPRGFASRPTSNAIEALAHARLTMDRPDPTSVVEDFGPEPFRPTISIVAGVGANLDLIRARAAMVFAEPGAEGVELVCHVPAGPLAVAARAAIADAAAVFGLPHRLVTVGSDADPATRLTAALRAARGPRALALGADVLPLGRGWLAHWARAMASDACIIGGTVLGVDGAVIDAGHCNTRRNRRHAPGLPGGGLPGSGSAATSRVIADCVGLSRAAVDLLLTRTVWHPEPDVMLAQVVAMAGGGKGARTLFGGKFMRYADDPVCDPLTLAADASALDLILKRSFSLVGEEGAP